jgi:hypothetical protein
MTVAIFLGALLGAMALGMPIAYALLVCGVALMLAPGPVRRADPGAERDQRRRQLPAAGGALLHAGRRDHERRRPVAAHRQPGAGLVGHVRGGLGYVAILAAVMMAALSGSAVADTAALAALLLPMMRARRPRQGPRRRADRRPASSRR